MWKFVILVLCRITFWNRCVTIDGDDGCLECAQKTKKIDLGTTNMWEPKLPLALNSARGNFGSHMLVVPRTTFFDFLAPRAPYRRLSWPEETTLKSHCGVTKVLSTSTVIQNPSSPIDSSKVGGVDPRRSSSKSKKQCIPIRGS